jgi:hypothetical protein
MTSHNRYPDIPEVDNDFAKPFRDAALQSPLLSGVPTGVNKPNGTGIPPLTNWPTDKANPFVPTSKKE